MDKHVGLEDNSSKREQKQKLNDRDRMMYLLSVFGVILILAVVGCFSCMQGTGDPLTNEEIFRQKELLRGSIWMPDDRSIGLNGLIAGVELRFENVLTEDDDLQVFLFSEGALIGTATVHYNFHGATMHIAGTDDELTLKISSSRDGQTITLTLEDKQRRKNYFSMVRV